MAYEIYKKEVTREQYFENWDPEQFSNLTKELADELYKDFLFKKEVLLRDSFTCQNKTMNEKTGELEPCINCKNVVEFEKITVHHVKHKRNGGENKVRNGVVICAGSHQAFNRLKRPLTFLKESENLPPHIRGHTFRLSRAEKKKNWKELRAEMSKLRKEYKHLGGNPINWKMIGILLRWLYKNT